MGEMRRLYYQTKEKPSFKTFKWILKGRWNQGTGNDGDTRTYQQWDELGISYVGSDGVKYGPTYWTVDSFSSSGTPWAGDIRGPADLFDGEWGSETSKCDYYNINDTDGYVEIIIHTTSGQAIIPNGVGLISANYQANYASSTPGHFILYGLNESTNEYVQLIDVGAASVNKGSTQTTTVSFEPVEVVSGTYYLLAPSDMGQGIGLRTTVPKLVYLTYFDDVSTSLGYINSTPNIDTANIGNLVSISNRFHQETFVSTNGTMPSTYVGKHDLSRTNSSSANKNDGLTWNFPYSRTDKFTVQWWALHNERTAGVIGPQVWTSPSYYWVHSFRNHFASGYGFLWYGDDRSVLTGYNGAVVSTLDGPSIKISAIPRGTWHHFAVVSDGSDLHFYVDGVRYCKKTGSWTTGDFQKFLMFDDDGGTSYTLSVTEIAIYDGDISYNDHNNIPVPTSPLGS